MFKDTKTGEETVIDYGWLATYPECKVAENLAPFLKDGLITIDPETLQHRYYDNVFSFGECTDLPTINNSIASMGQAQIVAGNIGCAKQNMQLKYKYNGSSATPIFLGMKRLILPGFKYGWEPINTMLTSDTREGLLTAIKQMLSFQVFKLFEKKFFAKQMNGKVYGPPKWIKPPH